MNNLNNKSNKRLRWRPNVFPNDRYDQERALKQVTRQTTIGVINAS